MNKTEKRNERELDYTCYKCDTTFKHTFIIERGLTGLKAKGHTTCPNCNYKVYAKIYLDREQGELMIIVEIMLIMFVIAFFLNVGMVALSMTIRALPMIAFLWILWLISKALKDE